MHATAPSHRRTYSPLVRFVTLLVIFSLMFGFLPHASALVEAGPSEGVNLLVNGGFETVAGGLPSGWSKWNASGTPQFDSDPAVFTEGGRSLRISAAVPARGSMSQSRPVEAGKSYNLSVLVKMDNIVSTDIGVVLRYQFYNASGQKVGTDSIAGARKGTSDWGQIVQKVTVPNGAVNLLFELFLWNATGTVWFDYAKLIKEASITDMISPQHPRLLATAADFAALQGRIATDARLAGWAALLKTKADNLLTVPVSQYEIPDGLRLLEVSRKVLDRTYTLAIQYRLTADSRYAERAWAELQAAGQFPDWNPRHFLDTAEMTHAFAIGYDWLYDYWTAERKTFLRDAMMIKGLTPALAGYNRPDFWVDTTSNWNFVVNGGIGMGALALGDEPIAKPVAEQLLQRGLDSLPKALPKWAPDGGWFEGPGYWEYAIMYIGIYFKAMQTALGTDFGLSASPGLPQNGEFPMYTSGPSNQIFNFGDAAPRIPNSPSLYWLGEQFGKPEYGWWQTQRVDANPSPLDLLWYVPNSYAGPRASHVSLDKYFRGVETVTLRSAWEDANALFVGLKGASEQKSHHNLDAGSFVLDALGVRWAEELGADDYNLPGYFGDQRWNYYRMRGEGQNTFVINPGAGPEQDESKPVPIHRFESSPQESMAIADLTDAYASSVYEAERGVRLLDNRRMVVVQDEVYAKAPSDFWWFMHTSAVVDEVAPDGGSVILKKDGKRLWARILSPSEAKFTVMDAAPLPTSPNPGGQNPNSGIRKLAIHLEDVEHLQLSVLFVPLREGEAPPASLPVVEALSGWHAGTPAPPLLSGIDLNGSPLAGFDGKTFTYDYTVFSGTTIPPVVTASSADANATVTVQQAANSPGTAWIRVTLPEGGETRYAVHFSEPNRAAGQAGLPIAEVTASGDDGNIPANTLDDDLSTRWSMLGDGEWIMFDLGSAQTVRSVSLAWYKGQERTASFDIAASNDGINWVNVFNGASSGLTDELENYAIGERTARYVKIVGHGNTQSMFNSMTEARLYDRVAAEQNKQPVLKSVSLTVDVPELKVSQSAQLRLSGTMSSGQPADMGAADVQYFSSDSSIASVSGIGLVTASREGKVKIAAAVRLTGYLKFGIVEIDVVDPLSIKLQPIKDTYVRDGQYAADNYGSDVGMVIKNSGAGFNRQSFMQFDLSNISGEVASAALYLYGLTNDSGGTSVDNTVHAVADDNWTETGLTWNNQPAHQEALATVNVGNQAAWHKFDMTPYIASQLAGDQIASLAIVQDATPGLVSGFNSRENSVNKPYLEVKLTDLNPPVLTVSGVTYYKGSANSATPVIEAADTESEVKTVSALLNGQPFMSGTAVTAIGIHTLIAFAEDYAGNRTEKSVMFAVYDPVKGPASAAGWFPESGTVTGSAYGKIHLVAKLGYDLLGQPEGRLSVNVQSSGLKLELQAVHMLAIDSSALYVQGTALGLDEEEYVVQLVLRQPAANEPARASMTVTREGIPVPVVHTIDRPFTGNVKLH